MVQGLKESIKILDLETNEVKTICTQRITKDQDGNDKDHIYKEIVFSEKYLKMREDITPIWNSDEELDSESDEESLDSNSDERRMIEYFRLYEIPSGKRLFKIKSFFSYWDNPIYSKFDVEKGVCHFFRHWYDSESNGLWTTSTFDFKETTPEVTFGETRYHSNEDMLFENNEICIANRCFVSTIEEEGGDLSLVVQPFPSWDRPTKRKIRPFLTLEENNVSSCPKLFCTRSKAVVGIRKADLKSKEFVLLDFNI